MATTINSTAQHVFGDRVVVTADLTITTTGDTWVTGLTSIEAFSLIGGSAAITSATKSGGTITITSAANTHIQGIAIGFA